MYYSCLCISQFPIIDICKQINVANHFYLKRFFLLWWWKDEKIIYWSNSRNRFYSRRASHIIKKNACLISFNCPKARNNIKIGVTVSMTFWLFDEDRLHQYGDDPFWRCMANYWSSLAPTISTIFLCCVSASAKNAKSVNSPFKMAADVPTRASTMPRFCANSDPGDLPMYSRYDG